MDYLWHKLKETAKGTYATGKKKMKDVDTQYIRPMLSSIHYHWDHIQEVRKNPVLRDRAVLLSEKAKTAKQNNEPFTVDQVYRATDNMFLLSKFFYMRQESYAPSEDEIMRLIRHTEKLNSVEKITEFYTDISN